MAPADAGTGGVAAGPGDVPAVTAERAAPIVGADAGRSPAVRGGTTRHDDGIAGACAAPAALTGVAGTPGAADDHPDAPAVPGAPAGLPGEASRGAGCGETAPGRGRPRSGAPGTVPASHRRTVVPCAAPEPPARVEPWPPPCAPARSRWPATARAPRFAGEGAADAPDAGRIGTDDMSASADPGAPCAAGAGRSQRAVAVSEGADGAGAAAIPGTVTGPCVGS